MKHASVFIGALILTACQNAVSPAVPTESYMLQDQGMMQLVPQKVLKVISGKNYEMYAYNKQIPGPLIRMTQGDTINIDVRNKIDMDTTVHWHGIRLDNAFDGVPDLTQQPIRPGGAYSQEIYSPDEGIYWYHPHVREDIQQDMGLYGNLFVKPKDPNAYNPVNLEQFLVLDDLMVDENGAIIPYGKDDPNFALMGRFGNLMLMNGAPAKDYSLSVPRGTVVRFFLTNVANTRTFNIKIDGGAMKLVGSDVGRYEKEQWVNNIIIAPAERYIVDVLFEDDGRYPLAHESPLAHYSLGSVTVLPSDAEPSYSESFYALRAFDDVTKDIDTFRNEFDRPVDKTLRLSIEIEGNMGMMHEGMEMQHSADGIEWEDTMPMMNATMASEDFQWKLIDEQSGKANMDFMWKFTKGDKVKVRIINDEDSAHPMQHPIHFHGQRFLVLSDNGVTNKDLVWKDTVLVPIGHTVDLLFDMSNLGKWMFHCHIAEHLTNGMMGMFIVTE